MVCDQYGRCWRERGPRRVIIQDSYDYAPRERYIERRGYYDGGYYNSGALDRPVLELGSEPDRDGKLRQSDLEAVEKSAAFFFWVE